MPTQTRSTKSKLPEKEITTAAPRKNPKKKGKTASKSNPTPAAPTQRNAAQQERNRAAAKKFYVANKDRI
jgi:hypothetical protein